VLHILRTWLTNPHTTNSDVTFPKLFFDVIVTPVAENRDRNMLFGANSGVQVRSDF
jgi:hypothetical protein